MADSNRVIQSTIANYSSKLSRAYLEETSLTNVLMERGSVVFNSSGLDHRWKVKTARNPNARSRGVFDKVDFVSTDNLTEANLDYGSYDSNDFLPRKERLQNRGSKEQIFDLHRQKLDDLTTDFKQFFNDQLWTGNGTGDNIVGINTALPSSLSGITYAAIAYSNSFWAYDITDGTSFDNSSFATDALIAIETAKLAATHNNSEPDFGLTTKALFATIADRHTSNERYRAVSDRKLGGSRLIVHDMDFLHDTNATANLVRLFNSRFMFLVYMTADPWEIRSDESVSPPGTWYYLDSYPLLKIEEPRYFSVITTT